MRGRQRTRTKHLSPAAVIAVLVGSFAVPAGAETRPCVPAAPCLAVVEALSTRLSDPAAILTLQALGASLLAQAGDQNAAIAKLRTLSRAAQGPDDALTLAAWFARVGAVDEALELTEAHAPVLGHRHVAMLRAMAMAGHGDAVLDLVRQRLTGSTPQGRDLELAVALVPLAPAHVASDRLADLLVQVWRSLPAPLRDRYAPALADGLGALDDGVWLEGLLQDEDMAPAERIALAGQRMEDLLAADQQERALTMLDQTLAHVLRDGPLALHLLDRLAPLTVALVRGFGDAAVLAVLDGHAPGSTPLIQRTAVRIVREDTDGRNAAAFFPLLTPQHRASMALSMAQRALQRGDVAAAVMPLQTALAAIQGMADDEAKSRGLQAPLLRVRLQQLVHQGHADEAFALLESCARWASELACVADLTRALAREGQGERALAVAEGSGNPHAAATVHADLAHAALAHGDLNTAEAHARAVHKLGVPNGDLMRAVALRLMRAGAMDRGVALLKSLSVSPTEARLAGSEAAASILQQLSLRVLHGMQAMLGLERTADLTARALAEGRGDWSLHLATVVEQLVADGDVARALQVLPALAQAPVDHQSPRWLAVRAVARGLAHAGQVEALQALASQIMWRSLRHDILLHGAEVAADLGRHQDATAYMAHVPAHAQDAGRVRLMLAGRAMAAGAFDAAAALVDRASLDGVRARWLTAGLYGEHTVPIVEAP